ncbi:uncharacterized protein LOC125218929 isoform X2 [Salvia hispanica]|uniref:uncharacterized protein LOC125218929 isoform X2 n=1 Tax=Salvia hispanica TaxID=49212 RepID=UPI002008F344|nr:uncharacterized protein LOC125218929 isoform X2 [Salvia hispanica]
MDDDGRELEAAEALAGMAQHVAVSQDQLVADYAPLKITSPRKAEESVRHIPTEQCSKSHRTNPVTMKMRRKLTEAEKEERKLRHIMANRESARQTIRRRQAMHMELNKRAADELEENENLKKRKELMLEVFNSLKGRNRFLKAHLAEARKAAAGVTEEEEKESNSSEAEKPCSATATTPMFLQQNQPTPSLVPCFWPPMASTSDAFPFQGTSHPHPLQFPMDTPPCLHQGQELSTVTPLFIVPVPWVLPLLGTNTHCCGKCSCSDARMSEDNNNKSCSNQNAMSAEAYNNPIMQAMSADGDRRAHEPPAGIVVPGLFSPVRRVENLDPPRAFQVGDHVVSPHETGLFRGKSEDIIVATEARRRRKELMRLKKVN